MDFELIKKEKITLAGIPIELTISQTENYRLIRKHWINFNSKLRSSKYISKSDWTKYGVTCKSGDKFFYMPAIPYTGTFMDFKNIDIPEGLFARFQHTGSMEKIKSTVYDIYKRVIPEKLFQVDNERYILHYELYDYRFQWNKENSIIDIYLPIREKTDE
jgi:predicted transcriptional regulator YdeE